ncbi:MAG: hypothetical protein HYZ37_10160 [Candidatus Solibacter usitatus]|nr:hypothetical protein [Candidatus Solibacter usitatus]
MDESQRNEAGNQAGDLKDIIRHVMREHDVLEREKAEPAYKTELAEERGRREQLERRVNELVEENQRSRKMAEEANRQTSIRSELMKHGVMKLDLAFRAIKDDVRRTSDGQLVAVNEGEELPLGTYVKRFVEENPEFLPARLGGGAGAPAGHRSSPAPSANIDIDKIRPGMDPKELERIREEIARVALQSMHQK